MKTLLLLTDFSYQAKGREYYREDVLLSALLRKFFHVVIAHIKDSAKIYPLVDAILIRNTGPQITHARELKVLQGLLTFNDLKGKGDILGKRHLLQLYQSGYPVIPSFSLQQALQTDYEEYLLKPLDGADSTGVKIVSKHELSSAVQNVVIQPVMDFAFEVSFYFIGNQFHYALYAPDPRKRWELQPYAATLDDIAFARKFIEWNTVRFGIQRVDACRLANGELLLMELEDYNPFLSLELLPINTREAFLENLCQSLEDLILFSRSHKIEAT